MLELSEENFDLKLAYFGRVKEVLKYSKSDQTPQATPKNYQSKKDRFPTLWDNGQYLEEYTKNRDVYDLGTIVFELATGQSFQWQISDITKMGMDFTQELADFLRITTEIDCSKRTTIEELASHPFINLAIEKQQMMSDENSLVSQYATKYDIFRSAIKEPAAKMTVLIDYFYGFQTIMIKEETRRLNIAYEMFQKISD